VKSRVAHARARLATWFRAGESGESGASDAVS
jgi:hypothetical protein